MVSIYSYLSKRQENARRKVKALVDKAGPDPLFGGATVLGVRVRPQSAFTQKAMDEDTYETVREAAGIDETVFAVMEEQLSEQQLEKLFTALAETIAEEEETGEKKRRRDTEKLGAKSKGLLADRLTGADREDARAAIEELIKRYGMDRPRKPRDGWVEDMLNNRRRP